MPAAPVATEARGPPALFLPDSPALGRSVLPGSSAGVRMCGSTRPRAPRQATLEIAGEADFLVKPRPAMAAELPSCVSCHADQRLLTGSPRARAWSASSSPRPGPGRPRPHGSLELSYRPAFGGHRRGAWETRRRGRTQARGAARGRSETRGAAGGQGQAERRFRNGGPSRHQSRRREELPAPGGHAGISTRRVSRKRGRLFHGSLWGTACRELGKPPLTPRLS